MSSTTTENKLETLQRRLVDDFRNPFAQNNNNNAGNNNAGSSNNTTTIPGSPRNQQQHNHHHPAPLHPCPPQLHLSRLAAVPSAFAPPSAFRTSPVRSSQAVDPISFERRPSNNGSTIPLVPFTAAQKSWLVQQSDPTLCHSNAQPPVFANHPHPSFPPPPPTASPTTANACSPNPAPVYLLGQHRIVNSLTTLQHPSPPQITILNHNNTSSPQQPVNVRPSPLELAAPQSIAPNPPIAVPAQHYMSHFTTNAGVRDGPIHPPQKKKRVYKARQLVCANSRCKVANTPLWRKGWTNPDGKTNVMLCNACGLHYKKGHYCSFCLQIYKEADAEDSSNPFVTCNRCSRWIHFKCAQARRLPEDVRKEQEQGIRASNLCQECLDLKVRDPAAFEGDAVIHKRRKKLHADALDLEIKKPRMDASLSNAGVPMGKTHLPFAQEMPLVINPANTLQFHASQTMNIVSPVTARWMSANESGNSLLQPQPMKPLALAGVQSSSAALMATPSQAAQAPQSVDVVSDSSCSSAGSSPRTLPTPVAIHSKPTSMPSKTAAAAAVSHPPFQDMLVVDNSIRPASIPGQVFHPAIGNPLDCLSAACEIERTTTTCPDQPSAPLAT